MTKVPEWQKISERLAAWNADNDRLPIRLHTLKLVGPVPSKKNNLAPRGPKGRLGVSRHIQSQLDALVMQAMMQWGRKAPLEHPSMDFRIHCLSGQQDRDNIVTSLLDCLKKAGVILDDSTARCNGRLVIHPSILATGDPFVEIGLGEIV